MLTVGVSSLLTVVDILCIPLFVSVSSVTMENRFVISFLWLFSISQLLSLLTFCPREEVLLWGECVVVVFCIIVTLSVLTLVLPTENSFPTHCECWYSKHGKHVWGEHVAVDHAFFFPVIVGVHILPLSRGLRWTRCASFLIPSMVNRCALLVVHFCNFF